LSFTAVGINSALSQSSEPIQPLATIAVNEAKVALGKRLFFETRLSVDDSMSCASCHDIDAWGAET